MTELEAAWLAGIIDGEAQVTLQAKTKVQRTCGRRTYYSPRVSIGMTFRPALDRIFELTGCGFVVERAQTNPAHKPLHTWTTTGRDATAVLARVLPYLVVKKRQAELLIQFQETSYHRGGGRLLTEDEAAVKTALASEIRELNQRGTGVT